LLRLGIFALGFQLYFLFACMGNWFGVESSGAAIGRKKNAAFSCRVF